MITIIFREYRLGKSKQTCFEMQPTDIITWAKFLFKTTSCFCSSECALQEFIHFGVRQYRVAFRTITFVAV